MADWKTKLDTLLLNAELARWYYLRARAKYQGQEMALGLALRKLQEHYERKPRREILGSLTEDRLGPLLNWINFFDRDKMFPPGE